ncbi:MAG: hypothetical protein FWH18_10380 [Marinilabiliaceae bacterium]|nr:hypothetical protein [Marinilabiliaceae bacterium]
METISQLTLNDAQLFVLQTLAITKGKQEKEELTSLYLDYVQKKMDKLSDKWWEENDMNNEKIQNILKTHIRTPYL